jgi:hypothetical protein
MRIAFPLSPAATAALLLIGASELALVSFSEPLSGMPVFQPTMDDAVVVAKRQLLPRAKGEVVLLGDSSCAEGLVPEVLQGRGLGRPVNLGLVVNFTLPGFAQLADEVSRLDPPPRAVVVAVLPRSFEVTEERAREFDMLGRYLVAYGKSSPEYGLRAADYGSWFFRKHRYNIFSPHYDGKFSVFADRMAASNGYLPASGTYSGPGPNQFQATFQPAEFSSAGFRGLAEAAAARDVPVILWWSPSPSDSVSTEYVDGASGCVRRLADGLPGLRLGRASAPTWEPRWFADIAHVTPEGAARNSEELAEYLASEGFSAQARTAP